ncbi:MAG: hypothetical protein M3495_16105, partial [Pseudomonadota bacterium]|nr:hypothetical protein [Pseudomonadota bacterium]
DREAIGAGSGPRAEEAGLFPNRDGRSSSAAMRMNVTGVLRDSRRDSSAIRRTGISTTAPTSA